MAQDTTIQQHFLATMLTRILEAQIQQGELLRGISAKLDALQTAQTTGVSAFSLVERWMPLLKPIASAAAQYAIGILTVAYVLKGGDLMVAVTALLKLL